MLIKAITMFLNMQINFLFIYFYLSKVVFNSERCGSPGRYKLTNFTIDKSSSNKYSNITDGYSEGAVIKYECINKNDEIISNEFRTCFKGVWNEKIPRCAKSLRMQAVVRFEIYGNMQNKSIDVSKTKSRDPLKAYSAKNRPHDCDNVTISDYRHQFLVIHLKTRSSFNYFKLSLSYPQISSINMNEPVITVTHLIDTPKTCKVINKVKYKLDNQLSETISIICELSLEITSNNSITNEYKEKLSHTTSKEIRLKFDASERSFSKELVVSICELRLFKYPINDCGEPDKPLNSIVSSNKDFAQFSCVDGYEMHPFRSSGYHEVVKCGLNSEWNGQFPTCHINYCNLPENITQISPVISFNNSEFSLINGKNTTKSGTIASYSCENITINGFKTQLSSTSSSSRTCLNGKWSGPQMECLIDEDVKIQTRLDIIIISMGCVLLLCLIIILSLIMFSLKRKRNKIKREVIIPRSEQTFSNNNELNDSIRISQLTDGSHNEYGYEDIDDSYQRMSTNEMDRVEYLEIE